MVYIEVPAAMLCGFSILALRRVLPKQAKCEGVLVRHYEGNSLRYLFVSLLGFICSGYVYRAIAWWPLLNVTAVKFILFILVTV